MSEKFGGLDSRVKCEEVRLKIWGIQKEQITLKWEQSHFD